MSTLSYYFKSQHIFKYNTAEPFLSSIGYTDSNAAPVSLPNNDSTIPVMTISHDGGGLPNYYTFNQIYISLTSLFNKKVITNSKYQLILQGNLDNFSVNSNNQIIIILKCLKLMSKAFNSKIIAKIN